MNQVSENPVKNRNDSQFFLTVISCLLVTFYLTANIMAVKVINVAGITFFDAGTIIFPLSYMLGDALTEIWGFTTARRVILLTFVCNAVMVFFTALGVILPAPDYLSDISAAYAKVFTYIPRIILASLLAFLSGELLNSWLMVKIKEKTGERLLWVRTIGSSAAAHFFDTVIFVFTAFYGTSPIGDLISMAVIQYAVKLGLEAIGGTPLAYGIIAYLKKKI